MVGTKDEYSLQRRVAGYHDIRLDGVIDITMRAKGMRVLDLGCNRGLIGFEMANNGAALVHGCDNYEPGILTARELFIDLRNVKSAFEVCDLTKEIPFPQQQYDITLMIATYHKIKRKMPAEKLTGLIKNLADRTAVYFVWRGPGDKPDEAEEEMAALDRDLGKQFSRVHTSYLSKTLGLAAIWEWQS